MHIIYNAPIYIYLYYIDHVNYVYSHGRCGSESEGSDYFIARHLSNLHPAVAAPKAPLTGANRSGSCPSRTLLSNPWSPGYIDEMI